MTGLRPDGVLAFVLLDVLIILVAARAVGALARRVGQPAVVGEIVAGVLLGPTLLGPTLFAWDQPWSWLQCEQALTVLPAEMQQPSITACLFPPQARSVLGILGQLALVLFMFLVGLELDFSLLKGKVKGILTVALGVVALPIALAFLIAPALYDSRFVAMFGTPAQPSQASFTLMVGAMLSVTAFPVMARILQEKKLTQSPMGSIGVAAAAVVTVLMFLAVAVASGVASNQGPSSLAVKFLLTGVYLAVVFLLVRPALAPLGRAYEARGGLTPGMFAGIMALVLASAYVAHRLGINVIVGGFVAGAVLPARAGLFRDMAARLSDVTAIVLLPIFLAFSGLATDFTRLGLSFMGGIALFLVAGIVGKWAGGAIFARLGGLSWAEGNVIGVLMNCRGLLVLVVGLIAFQQGVISAPLQVGGVLMALITTAMTGPLFDAFIKRVPQAAPAVPGEAVPAAGPAGAYRVLAVLTDLDRAPSVAHTAFAAATGLRGDPDRPAEVVFCRLFPLPPYGELLSGINDELVQVDRSMRAVRMLGSFRPEGVAVTPIAAGSDDVAGDVLRIARDRACDVVVVEWQPASADLAQRLVAEAPCAVVVHSAPAGDGATHDGPVTVVGPPAADAGTLRMAEALAAGLGQPVERVAVAAPAVTPEDVQAAAVRSGAVVVVLPGGSVTGALGPEAAPSPVYVYVPQPAPAAAVPAGTGR
jgi:Kef-type K+ transport system membrane component KefB